MMFKLANMLYVGMLPVRFSSVSGRNSQSASIPLSMVHAHQVLLFTIYILLTIREKKDSEWMNISTF